MTTRKLARKLVVLFPFLLLGTGYFAVFSHSGMHPLLEFQLFLLPIQLGFAAYFLLWPQPSKRASSGSMPLDRPPDVK